MGRRGRQGPVVHGLGEEDLLRGYGVVQVCVIEDTQPRADPVAAQVDRRGKDGEGAGQA